MQDRTNLTPELLQRMRRELVELLSKYVEMDKDALELNFDQEGDQMALMLSIPVIRAKDEEEIEKALAKADEKEAEEDKLLMKKSVKEKKLTKLKTMKKLLKKMMKQKKIILKKLLKKNLKLLKLRKKKNQRKKKTKNKISLINRKSRLTRRLFYLIK